MKISFFFFFFQFDELIDSIKIAANEMNINITKAQVYFYLISYQLYIIFSKIKNKKYAINITNQYIVHYCQTVTI